MRLFEEISKLTFQIQHRAYCSICKEHFDTKNDFLMIFLSEVKDNLISHCLITLKINYQDMVKIIDLHTNLLKILRTIGLKHNFLSLTD